LWDILSTTTIKKSKEILLFIGPEGDFNNDEKKFLKEVGEPVQLSTTRLRVETAALVMATGAVLAFKK